MITKTFNIDEANINKRLDSFLSDILDDISRGLVQQLIEQGNVLVNDVEVKKNYKLRLNDQIHVILQFPEVTKVLQAPETVAFIKFVAVPVFSAF